MADNVSTIRRSRIMGRIGGKNTSCEMHVRQALHRAGFRFRLHRKDLPGKPDIVLPKYRLAIFVHGCFWHWHGCKRSRMPSSNVEYWRSKIERNMRRDERNLRLLESTRWDHVIIWECELPAAAQSLLAHLDCIKQSLSEAHKGGP